MKPSSKIGTSTALVLHPKEMGILEPSFLAVGATGSDATHEDLVFFQVVKDTFKEDQEKADEYWELMQDLKYRRIDPREVVTRVKDLFRGHRVLILGFNTFLPARYQIALPKKPKVEYRQFTNFINKVKMRFQDDEDVYHTFLEKVQMHCIKSILEAYQEVAHLFNTEHADLVEEFSYFLPHYICAVFPGFRVNLNSRAEEDTTGKCQVGQSSLLELEETVEEKIVSECWETKQVVKYNYTRSGTRGKERVGDGTQDNSKPSNLAKDWWKRVETGTEKKKNDSLKLGERDTAIKTGGEENEKDLEDLQRGFHHKCKSAKQVHRPIKKRKQSQTNRKKESCGRPLRASSTKLAERVFNDSQVSVTFRREDYSFKTEIDQCDDDRFELDVLIGRAASTARKVAELVEYIEGPQFKQQMSTFVLEDHLSAINLRCIETIYGDCGLEFVDQIRENPSKALPVILIRLKQKHDEWFHVRIEMEEMWAKDVLQKMYTSP